LTELSDLLARLEEHWRRVDAPVARAARPGLPPEEIDRLTAEVNIFLPAEARTWFEWHDGSGEGVDFKATMGPRFGLWSLSLLVATYRRERAQVKEWHADPEDPRIGWPKAWFPITQSDFTRDVVVVDCSVEAGQPTGVGHVGTDGNYAVGIVPSLTDLVRFWVSCHDAGLYSWDSSAQHWRTEPGPPGNSPYGNFYH
jgi:cell wall assembly regulator SMI1